LKSTIEVLMSAVVQDSGKEAFLNYLTGNGGHAISGCKYHLYVNNVVPNHADTLGTYTEASWAGYSAQTAGGWTVAGLDGTFHATSSANNLTWANTSGGSVSVYGYYVTDSASAMLLFSELFAGAPLTIPNGMTLILTPNVTDTSEF
jgi:hypothetical protein